METRTTTFEEFDQFEQILERMDYKAGPYAPTVDEINSKIAGHLDKYVRFLVWIDETGYETEENKEARAQIRRILAQCLVLTEAEEAAQSIGQEHFEVTFDEYDRFVEELEDAGIEAGPYAPSMEEIQEKILQSLPKYLEFLIWIEETGKETAQNKESRKAIRNILMDRMSLVEDGGDEQ